MNESFIGQWLPQKFDLTNDNGATPLEHFGEYGKAIGAWTEMLLYILVILLFPILLGVAFAFITNPRLGIQAFLSAF